MTWSLMASTRPPRSNATTGVPQACASAAAMPKGSSHMAGHRTTAARAICSHRTALGIAV